MNRFVFSKNRYLLTVLFTWHLCQLEVLDQFASAEALHCVGVCFGVSERIEWCVVRSKINCVLYYALYVCNLHSHIERYFVRWSSLYLRVRWLHNIASECVCCLLHIRNCSKEQQRWLNWVLCRAKLHCALHLCNVHSM